MDKLSKLTRQLYIYYLLENSNLQNPNELMMQAGITNRRMLQRDLKDLRDSGLYNAVYEKGFNDKGENMSYYYSEETCFDESSTGARRAHLIRLNRLGTLIVELPTTDYGDYDFYLSALNDYNILLDSIKDDPNITKKDLAEAKEEVDYYAKCIKNNNIKDIYQGLFPDENERTRQRDFEEINRIPGFTLYYDRKLMTYIYFNELFPE